MKTTFILSVLILGSFCGLIAQDSAPQLNKPVKVKRSVLVYRPLSTCIPTCSTTQPGCCNKSQTSLKIQPGETLEYNGSCINPTSDYLCTANKIDPKSGKLTLVGCVLIPPDMYKAATSRLYQANLCMGIGLSSSILIDNNYFEDNDRAFRDDRFGIVVPITLQIKKRKTVLDDHASRGSCNVGVSFAEFPFDSDVSGNTIFSTEVSYHYDVSDTDNLSTYTFYAKAGYYWGIFDDTPSGYSGEGLLVEIGVNYKLLCFL